MRINNKFLIILLYLKIAFFTQVFAEKLNNQQYIDSIYYPGLEEYLDVYFDFYYDYPQNLSELLLFIDYYNDNGITSDSYCGLDLMEITIPKIKKNQDRLFSYSTDSCFSLWLDNDILILKVTPRSETPCKYLILMENGFYDKRSRTYDEGVLFFNNNMAPIIHGLQELTNLFYSLKISLLQKYSENLEPILFENGMHKRQFYVYEKEIGLSYLCENHNDSLNNTFYNELSKEIGMVLEQNALAKVVFCMGVYTLK